MLSLWLVAAILVAGPALGGEGDEPGATDHSAMGHEDHAGHAPTNVYARSEGEYEVPRVVLTSQYGDEVSLVKTLDSSDPVLLNFIYTSCTTVCPLMTATFAQFRSDVPQGLDRPRMISITVDPEHDTPDRLREYAGRFGAGPDWQFLTGSLDDIIQVQKAFDAYDGGKLTHKPVTLLRSGTHGAWVRMEGFPAASDLVREYEGLGAR